MTSQYNFYRTYDPTTGRYLEPDPIGLGGGPNPFAYALGNPVNFVDPLGLRTTVVVRCGFLGSGVGGSSGAVHCEIVASCDATGETIATGIGGGGNTIWSRLFGGFTPPKDWNPQTGIPSSRGAYPTSCQPEPQNACPVMDRLRASFENDTPPPYYALWQNSNTYAHRTLENCGCSLNPIMVPFYGGNPMIDTGVTIPVTRPPGAVGW